MPPTLNVFGIRHHGPGSARLVQRALDDLRPDRVLIEGPPDADAILPFAAREEMIPPVSILVYATDDSKNACYYPFARFSPEWVAIRWALKANVPVRFLDLPQTHRMAETEGEDAVVRPPEPDPLAELAKLAGYDDGERWWEHLVEHGRDQPAALFDGIRTAMAAVREGRPDIGPHERRREAWMRKTIREEMKSGAERVAAVCGAWHAPAIVLDVLNETKAADDALLKGLPKVKTTATWVPWTHGRLTFASGYGAGVHAPGWYDHLWTTHDHVLERWLARAARLLRQKDIDCSSAHVIEATRLAGSLAGFRGRPLPDLADIADATRAVFCHDSDLPMRLIDRELLVGERIGEVPDDAPAVPLQQDLQREQKRLRMKPEAAEKVLDLDLRQDTDRDRSHLLYRLRLLGVRWGDAAGTGGQGTFKETWRLRWEPEFAVALVEKAAFGNTVPAAAAAAVREKVKECDDLRQLAAMVGDVLLADLPDAADAVLHRVGDVAAVAADVATLLDAVPPLAAVRRYGSVRKTDAALVDRTLDGLLPRIVAGLPAAVSSLDDDAAAAADKRIAEADRAVQMLENADHTAAWQGCLKRIVHDDAVHGLVRGGAARRLSDAGAVTNDDVAALMGLSLSPGANLANSAAWLEGFFRGSGLLLLHDARLLGLIDGWVRGVPAERFDEFLPLVRRTFATFPKPERKQIGQQLAAGAKPTDTPVSVDAGINSDRARRVVPVLTRILGGGP